MLKFCGLKSKQEFRILIVGRYDMKGIITAIMLSFLVTGVPLFAASPPATEADVSALESSARAGNREAIRALFSLHARSDGAVAEYIDIVLGGTIRMHPQVFLEELHLAGRKIRLDSLLGNTGPDLVDRFQEQAVELKKRKAALLTVHKGSLIQLRDECIRELDRQIETVTNAAQQSVAPDRQKSGVR
jgi:hypothetical protein